MASVRLNKFLASRLGISRRAADAAIAAGQVTIDGRTAQIGARLELPTSVNSPESPDFSQIPIDKLPKVCYNGSGIDWVYSRLYLAMNKPVGYVCSRRRQGQFPTVYELLPAKYHQLKAAGRLDRDSSGLLLFTNDGDFAQRMTHPRYAKTKIYEVELDRPLEPLHQQLIADFGIDLPDGRSQLGLAKLDATRRAWRVTMHEGRNRQIRRTFAAVGYTVVRLYRIQFGPYALGDLKSGAFQEIQPQ